MPENDVSISTEYDYIPPKIDSDDEFDDNAQIPEQSQYSEENDNKEQATQDEDVNSISDNKDNNQQKFGIPSLSIINIAKAASVSVVHRARMNSDLAVSYTDASGTAHSYRGRRMSIWSISGKKAFCIQPYEAMQEDAEYDVKSESDHIPVWSKELTDMQRSRIQRAIYYYAHSPGGTTNAKYIATQCIIWDIITKNYNSGTFYNAFHDNWDHCYTKNASQGDSSGYGSCGVTKRDIKDAYELIKGNLDNCIQWSDRSPRDPSFAKTSQSAAQTISFTKSELSLRTNSDPGLSENYKYYLKVKDDNSLLKKIAVQWACSETGVKVYNEETTNSYLHIYFTEAALERVKNKTLVSATTNYAKLSGIDLNIYTKKAAKQFSV